MENFMISLTLKKNNEFLMVFEQNFVPKFCAFTIINRQRPARDGLVKLTDSRVWVTNVYQVVYFNEFVRFGMAEDIKKRIIFNSLYGSSWRFKGFDCLSISMNTDEDRQTVK